MKKLFLLFVVLFMSGHAYASPGTGSIDFTASYEPFSVGQYANVTATLNSPDYGNYTYRYDLVDTTDTVRDTGTILEGASFPGYDTSSEAFDQIGTWYIILYSCGYGNCIINRADMDFDATVVSAGATPTPTPTPNATEAPSSGSMPVVFNVSTGGQFYAFKNGELFGLATYGYNVTVNYSLGDTIAFIAYPYSSYSVGSVCDVPYTECRYEQSYSYTVIGQLPDAIVASFIPTSGNMSVLFQATGEGQVYVFRNGSLEGLVSEGYDATVNYSIGDGIQFIAYPYLNNYLISVCDFPFTECQNETTYSYTVVGQLPVKMIFVFSNIRIGDNASAMEEHGVWDEMLGQNGYTTDICGLIAMTQDWSLMYVMTGMILFTGRLFGGKK